MELKTIIPGLVGALIGAVTASFWNWWNARCAAREALRLELIKLKIFEVHEIGKGRDNFVKIYKDGYPMVLAAMSTYRTRIYCTHKIDRAWEHYRSGDNLENRSSNKYFHSVVKTDEEFQLRIDRMLEALD